MKITNGIMKDLQMVLLDQQDIQFIETSVFLKMKLKIMKK